MKNIINIADVTLADIDKVGGKNASLGEIIQNLSHLGIECPKGIAITVHAYKTFLAENQLDKKINKACADLKVNNIAMVDKVSKRIQKWIIASHFSKTFKNQLATEYAKMKATSVAVRSSATSEDLDNASFAGSQETFLNVKGINNILKAIKHVYASLFSARAISYRHHVGFKQTDCSISIGIQPMIRSDKAASGVVFTLDTESGFDKVILISSSYGLGEAIVQGEVDTDEFLVYKPALQDGKYAILQKKLGEKLTKKIYTKEKSLRHLIKQEKVPKSLRSVFSLTDKEVEKLAKFALTIEKYYKKPMDIEWAKDGTNGKIYIVQARPITVNNTSKQVIETYVLAKKGKVLITGQSIGQRIGSGTARVITDIKNKHLLKPGDILVTEMTDPDWEPIMKIASAIVTNGGGRTCHAAIIARELGLPAVVGCKTATKAIKKGKPITVSCAEGQTGIVYENKLPFQVKKVSVKDMPQIPLKICVNMGNPDRAFETQFLPNEGVGLARLEFVIANMIGIHPNAALQMDKLAKNIKRQILDKTIAYASPKEYYIERMREGISMIAAAFFPKQVIFRFSDFKSNEYKNLLGGDIFEPHEENPMIGFRGASRYRDPAFVKCFELECQAFKRVREKMGLINAQLMLPFVRTVPELKSVLDLMEKFGLKRGVKDLKIYMMCEIPSNVMLATEFLQYVDGFSIGSNDLTQLTLGLDRDSNTVSAMFDERNPAVKQLLHMAITECKKQKKYIGICGQGPSDYPDFAEWLMKEGIEAVSLNADTIVETWLRLGKLSKGGSKN